MIKDSGKRRKFETGAVRDIDETKGRCDLLPLCSVGALLKDNVLYKIGAYQINGDCEFLYNAFEDFSKEEYVNVLNALLDLSIHFKEGAEKYGEHNWQKGIPTHCYIDSAVRHYLKYKRGDVDERHDRAFLWNILCCIWTCTNMPELNDYEEKKAEENE